MVEEEERTVPKKKQSIWDNFDISKVSNAGFKLEYVAPTLPADSTIVDIELET